MSTLPSKTVSVQIKLDLWRPGTLNYPKYSNPKYRQRRVFLTSGRISGGLIKCLTQITCKTEMALLLHRCYDVFYFFRFHCLVHFKITIATYNDDLTTSPPPKPPSSDETDHIDSLLPVWLTSLFGRNAVRLRNGPMCFLCSK